MHDGDIDKRARARIGTVVDGKYTLESLLGIGGMAAVYRARHRNGTLSAVKVLHEELAVVADIRARFLREGYVANQVDHPGAVRVLDDDVAPDGAVYLVMELLEGASLEDRIEARGGTLPAPEIVAVVSALLDVLVAAHERGIVHRDLKPENVFVCLDGSVKLLDFGVARLRDGAKTTTGAFLGTPQYMAPEQARGDAEASLPPADIWAVGAILFRALAGRAPHDAANAQRALVAAATQSVPPLQSLVPDVEPGVAAVVDRALAALPADRYPDAATMKAALASLPMAVAATDPIYPVLGRSSAAAEGGGAAASPPRPRPSRRWPVLFALALFWLALVGIGGLSFRAWFPRHTYEEPAPSASASEVPVAPTVAPLPSTSPDPEPTVRSAAPKDHRRGFLNVTAYPVAEVRVGTRVICAATPCKVSMTVGRHLLTFKFQEGAPVSEQVWIKEGETTSIIRHASPPPSPY